MCSKTHRRPATGPAGRSSHNVLCLLPRYAVAPPGVRREVAANHPDAADKTYGFALSASLSRAFPCSPG
jgi:hypothetical protein